jgi:hypothetical protein
VKKKYEGETMKRYMLFQIRPFDMITEAMDGYIRSFYSLQEAKDFAEEMMRGKDKRDMFFDIVDHRMGKQYGWDYKSGDWEVKDIPEQIW